MVCSPVLASTGMKATYKFALMFLLVCPMSLPAAAQVSSSPNQSLTLGDLGREIRAKRQAENGSPALAVTPPDDGKASKNVEAQPLALPAGFAELDALADKARSSKERIPGGPWTLYVFYDSIVRPAEGDGATNDQWVRHIAALEKWVAARPESITARVALAEAYRLWGWKVRGGSSARSVNSDQLREYRTQVDKAFTTLTEAEKLQAKCPHWYFVMLEVARDQDWDKERTRALFERAITLEPAYYHSYREYAYYLLPKSHGAAGEAEAFAEESYERLSSPQNAIIYYEIATVIYCMCSNATDKPTLSWSKIKEGYAEVEQLYGATILKLNRFALLAYLYRDPDVAKRAFAQLGDRWDLSTWRNRDTFNVARDWAGLSRL
jgi:hypothetical protein